MLKILVFSLCFALMLYANIILILIYQQKNKLCQHFFLSENKKPLFLGVKARIYEKLECSNIQLNWKLSAIYDCFFVKRCVNL